MVNIIPFPASEPQLKLLAELAHDAPPATCPSQALGHTGMGAAGLITERVDRLPPVFADPASAWTVMPPEMQAVVRQRKPGMAALCAERARREEESQ